MYTTINKQDFIQAFRAIRPDNFSYEGLCELYEMLSDWEFESGQPIELDVIALCCEYEEETAEELANYYNIPIDSDKFDGDALQTVMEWLSDESGYAAVTAKGTIVCRQF